MSGFFKRPSGAVRVLRALALFVLAYQARLYLKNLVSLPGTLILCLIATAAGILSGRSRLRTWVRLLLAAALPFLLRLGAFGLFRLAGVFSPGSMTDHLFPVFDETFFPLLPLWWWAFLAADFSERHPRFSILEAGLNLVVLAALFWSQGSFRTTLYPHPSLLASAAGVLLFLTLGVLAARGPKLPARKGGFLLGLGGFFLALLLVLLFVFGGYADDASARGGGLLRPTLFRFDLSRYLKLETEISLSDELVLLVRKDPRDPNIFLRRFVLSEYDGDGTFRPDPKGRDAPERLPKGPAEWALPAWEGRRRLEQEYWILTLDPGALLAVDAPASVAPYRLEAGSSFSSAYSLVSRAPEASLPLGLESFDPQSVPPGFDLSAADWDRYTRWGNNPQIRELAEEAAAGAETYYGRVTAVLRFLRENYYYSLRPGAAADGDQLEQFLFRGKKGYCSYFAFSMTILLRSLGVPVRVAAGFFVDPAAAVLEYHPVRADMAHAWTEVWFGPYGWISFDPTSRVPAPGERFEESRGLDPALLESLLREILRGVSRAEGGAGGGIAESGSAGRVIRAAALWALRRSWFLVPGFYLLLIAAVRGFRTLRTRMLAPGRRRALAAWDALERSLEAAGARRPRGESVPDFADRLDRGGRVLSKSRDLPVSGFGPLARAWEAVVYAPRVDPGETAALVDSLSRLRAEVRTGTPLWRRAAAFLDIRTAFRPLPGRGSP